MGHPHPSAVERPRQVGLGGRAFVGMPYRLPADCVGRGACVALAERDNGGLGCAAGTARLGRATTAADGAARKGA